MRAHETVPRAVAAVREAGGRYLLDALDLGNLCVVDVP